MRNLSRALSASIFSFVFSGMSLSSIIVKITGCGYFETNSPSASITAGTTSECKSEQTLAYSGTLIDMLNAYVAASSDSGLKRWTADYSGKLTLDF